MVSKPKRSNNSSWRWRDKVEGFFCFWIPLGILGHRKSKGDGTKEELTSGTQRGKPFYLSVLGTRTTEGGRWCHGPGLGCVCWWGLLLLLFVVFCFVLFF